MIHRRGDFTSPLNLSKDSDRLAKLQMRLQEDSIPQNLSIWTSSHVTMFVKTVCELWSVPIDECNLNPALMNGCFLASHKDAELFLLCQLAWNSKIGNILFDALKAVTSMTVSEELLTDSVSPSPVLSSASESPSRSANLAIDSFSPSLVPSADCESLVSFSSSPSLSSLSSPTSSIVPSSIELDDYMLGEQRPRLWIFLWLMLSSGMHEDKITWFDKINFGWVFVDKDAVCRIWGEQKKRRREKNMTYGSMSRSLRTYYKKGIMTHHPKSRYKFYFTRKALTKQGFI
ncbi:hypothetical protein L596_022238 [Steinernema carpocapsae]|uniref:ETS domain-containing protein n=1 Tax=Steinernema carpocapsae TaxID=34508 RepID=A0A4U5MLZ5_STECR|nr:hypothetical protein L596_022238 [Steinernema carpocapsae]